MMDPILSLAFSVQANKGVYALLVGSGISRAAGIPTGWEIIVDLTRKVGLLQGADCGADPAGWYLRTFGKEPSYSDLLDALAKSSAERGQLLRPYIEPSLEEREQGKKQPTAAHKAIAELVAAGYLRVLVTTNFDRLLEQALEAIGITPTVIYTPDAADGATPLVHSACTVIKVHGDYLDTRSKNTPDELASYDSRIDALLDRVFDEYGLIVCGWSGDWDAALRDAIARCKSRRYTTFWASRGEPSRLARDVITVRRAQVVSIEGADAFFCGLSDKVLALEAASRPHPLSVSAAVETLKRFLPDPLRQIRLHDLVMDEAERVKAEMAGPQFSASGKPFDKDELLRRINRYMSMTEVLRGLLVAGAHWGTPEHNVLWVKATQRLADDYGPGDGLVVYLEMRLFPCLLLLYSGCLSAMAAGHYGTAAALLRKVSIRKENQKEPAFWAGYAMSVLSDDAARKLPEMKRMLVATSEVIFAALRESLRAVLPDDAAYEEHFDRLERLWALAYAMEGVKRAQGTWAPMGRFVRLHRHRRGTTDRPQLAEEIEAEGVLVQAQGAGLLVGDAKVLVDCLNSLDQRAAEIARGF